MKNVRKYIKAREENDNIEDVDYKEKLNRHRRSIVKRIILLVILCVGISIMYYIYVQRVVYTNYKVKSSQERADSSQPSFIPFSDYVLKYSSDGATYMDAANHMIWNQTYEMQKPIVDSCEKYVAIAEEGGNAIYVLDSIGLQSKIETTKAISQIEISAEGTVIVMMEEDSVSYMGYYDKQGNYLADGEMHIQNNGYPIDVSLSNDGKKLAISYIGISEGKIQTTIAFYNFGSVGQNEIDKLVAFYSYPDAIFPQVEFVTNDRLIAFGNKEIKIYEGKQKPVLIETLDFKEELLSIFYNEDYFGFVVGEENSKIPYNMKVYNYSLQKEFERSFAMDYTQIGFSENGKNDILVQNELECSIYNSKGVEKFNYKFDQEIYGIFAMKEKNTYMLLKEGITEKIKLERE